MTTDPGDLVLDPTCGSGTTAYVAEQWGRRWITIDTSRVALALARARIMGARYPWYLLADSREGQLKEAEVTRALPADTPTYGRLRHGFVYRRVPHITLKSIANNAEIDTIWESFQTKLEPLREAINAALGTDWQEWDMRRDLHSWHRIYAEGMDDERFNEAFEAHEQWWALRIARAKGNRRLHRRQGRHRISLRPALPRQFSRPRRRSLHRGIALAPPRPRRRLRRLAVR